MCIIHFWKFRARSRSFYDVNDLFRSYADDVSVMMTCSILSSYHWSAGSNLIPGLLKHILQAYLFWTTEKRLQKGEVSFSDDFLSAVDVVFASTSYYLYYNRTEVVMYRRSQDPFKSMKGTRRPLIVSVFFLWH